MNAVLFQEILDGEIFGIVDDGFQNFFKAVGVIGLVGIISGIETVVQTVVAEAVQYIQQVTFCHTVFCVNSPVALSHILGVIAGAFLSAEADFYIG
jgi:hypothetical protein